MAISSYTISYLALDEWQVFDIAFGAVLTHLVTTIIDPETNLYGFKLLLYIIFNY